MTRTRSVIDTDDISQLKKLINQTVTELDSLGLGPSVLQSLCKLGCVENHISDTDASYKHAKFEYEMVLNSSQPIPRLRLSLGDPSDDHSFVDSTTEPIYHLDLLIPEQLLNNITTALLHSSITFKDKTVTYVTALL